MGTDGDPPSAARSGPAASDGLAAVHSRFGRAVVGIYLATAGVALILWVAALASDREYQEASAREDLLLSAETRSRFLGRELGLLGGELRRLGLRSEVDLLDQDLQPERSLLRLAHEKSAFFNVGVAIIGADGKVVWEQPVGFLNEDGWVADTEWFQVVKRSRDVRLVPVSPESPEDSLVYLVSPVYRAGRFSGVLLGAIDLAMGSGLEPLSGSYRAGKQVATVLTTSDGAVVYPPKPPDFAADSAWHRLFTVNREQPFESQVTLRGVDYVVAGGPVPASTGLQGSPNLVLLSLSEAAGLYAPARARLWTRLALGVGVALVPMALFVLLLRRTLRVFQRAQEEAARGERLRMLGEAANLIAHEIKNALNGLQIGIDVLTHPARQLAAAGGGGVDMSERRTVTVLRGEVERLSSFTTRLLTFSKGLSPRRTVMDLAGHVHKICDLASDLANERGVELEVITPETLILRADAALMHVVVSNLLSNALDALAGSRPPLRPAILVSVGRDDGRVFVRVTDNGPGLPPALREQLFEPFVTGKPSGVGIGLALSRKIARAHDGELMLERTAVGASFLLTISSKAEEGA